MVIDIERIKRLISEIRNATPFILDLTKKPFESLSEADKHAIRYNLIVIAEAVASIAMHLAKNLFNVTPETPIHALRLSVGNYKRLLSRRARDIGSVSKERNGDLWMRKGLGTANKGDLHILYLI